MPVAVDDVVELVGLLVVVQLGVSISTWWTSAAAPSRLLDERADLAAGLGPGHRPRRGLDGGTWQRCSWTTSRGTISSPAVRRRG